MNLTAFIKEETGLRIADDEVMLPDFGTITVTDRVLGGRGAGPA